MMQSIFPAGLSLHSAANGIERGRFSVVKSALRADGARNGGRDAPAALAAPADRVELQSPGVAAVPEHIHQMPPLYGRDKNANAGTDAETADVEAEGDEGPDLAGASEKDGENAGTGEAHPDKAAGDGGQEPYPAEQKQLDELKARDREVRAHEQAHKSAGGRFTGSVSYTYQQGPDGNRYAVGGEVSIDISPERDPAATAAKMRQVRAAAMAPAEPSSQDRAVAAKATQLENEAKREVNRERAEKTGESGAAVAGDGNRVGGESAEGAEKGGGPLPVAKRTGFGGPPETAVEPGRVAGGSISPIATLGAPYARRHAGAAETIAFAVPGPGRLDVTA